MTTHVQERAHLALGVAHHQDRVFPHVRTEEVARLWDLTLVAEEEPAAGKDPFQLLLVDLTLDEDPLADESAIGVDEMSELCRNQLLISAHFSAAMSCAQRW